MSTALTILAVWFLVGVPVALLASRRLAQIAPLYPEIDQ